MASRASAASQHSEARLLQQRGRIVGLEEAQERLHAAHRKLAGRIYADEYHGNLPRAAAPTANELQVCENYQRAQVEGPMSAAARCECGYCTGMRAQRDAFRSAVVRIPTAAARVNGVTDGQE